MLGRVPLIKTRKYIHINMCLETICGFNLKTYKWSRLPARDSMHALTRLTKIVEFVQGCLGSCWYLTVPLRCEQEQDTQQVSGVPAGSSPEDWNLAGVETMQWVLLYLSIGHVIENISHKTPRCAGAPSWTHSILSTTINKIFLALVVPFLFSFSV
jgi:hypothetical protein